MIENRRGTDAVSPLRKNMLTFGILMAIIATVWMIEMIRETLNPHRRTIFYLGLVITGLVMLLLALSVHFSPVSARDFGQWDRSSEVSKWYQTLMQPDSPTVSCCGEADAYWCDILKTEAIDGKVRNYCLITDDRPDAPRQRPHIEIGTEIEIPDHKMKWDRSNPTGHNIVFVSRGLYVYCFVQGTGI